MAGKTLDLRDILTPDNLATAIANKQIEWDMLRAQKKSDWREIREYIFATDTTQIAGQRKLPWKNKTVIPKLCQVRDNLLANYIAVMFPKRRWLKWEAALADSASQEKRDAIISYMSWVISHPAFKKAIHNLILDYIDYGNVFCMPEWIDQSITSSTQEKVGYVGPSVRRISPLDIVFNPIAPSFDQSPKIVRSIVTIGEIKKILDSNSTEENKEDYQKLFDYLVDLRATAKNYAGDISEKDAYLAVDGFTSFRQYLCSDYCEILTFYGDLYDYEKRELLQNHVIMVVDRHKLISKRMNDSLFGFPPIFHAGWRKRQDNLWAMGPLDNLVGMQYKINHLENLRADIMDLVAAPPLKIKGYVPDFTWAPFAKIPVGDDGDVEMIVPAWQAGQLDQAVALYEMKIEEMAGSPKEAMGFRTPGEKTAYEVQRLENAASRIFQNKIAQFEEQVLEPLLNAMLELARRKIVNVQTIPVFNDETQGTDFATLSAADITGIGTIRPVGARHFAERAELIQNLTNFFSSEVGRDPLIRAQFSAVQFAALFEDLLEIQDYKLRQPFVRMAEEADAQLIAQVHQENVLMETQTSAGIKPDDFDASMMMPEGLDVPDNMV